MVHVRPIRVKAGVLKCGERKAWVREEFKSKDQGQHCPGSDYLFRAKRLMQNLRWPKI